MNRRLVPVIAAVLAAVASTACSGGGNATDTTTPGADAGAGGSAAATTTPGSGQSSDSAPTTTGAPRPAADATVGEPKTVAVGDFRAVTPPDDCPVAPTTTTEALPPLTKPAQPKVDVPKSAPTELVVTDLIEGTGARKATTGDLITFYYVGLSIPDGAELDTNYNEDEPVTSQLGVDANLPGWTQGMEGVTAGTRRQIDIPASLALGDTESEQLPANASLTLVVDVIVVAPGPPIAEAAEEPEADYPALPTDDQITYVTERVGDRCALAEPGDQVYLNVKIVDAKTGDTIQSSWERGRAAVVTLDDAGFPGLVEAAIGMGVGEVRAVAVTPSASPQSSTNPDPAPAPSDQATADPGADGVHYLVEFVGFV